MFAEREEKEVNMRNLLLSGTPHGALGVNLKNFSRPYVITIRNDPL